MENMWKTLGSWLLLLGIVIAVIVGLVFGANTTLATNQDITTPIMAVLAVLGFVVGVLSFFAIGTITKEKVPMFLIGTLILVGLSAWAQYWSSAWGDVAIYFTNIVAYLAVFAAPAAILLAIRALWDAGIHKDILPKFTK